MKSKINSPIKGHRKGLRLMTRDIGLTKCQQQQQLIKPTHKLFEYQGPVVQNWYQANAGLVLCK